MLSISPILLLSILYDVDVLDVVDILPEFAVLDVVDVVVNRFMSAGA